MQWNSLPIIAFDTETTGLSPFAGDRVIEFGAVVLHVGRDGRVAKVEKHDFLFNPGIPIPPKVVQLTGIDDAMVANKPPFEDLAMKVRQLLTGGICVAHNYAFDRNFISEEFRRAGLAWPDPIGEVDTVDLSMRMFPEARSHKLSELCKRLDVDLDNAHRATDDAEACGRCFVELTRRREAPGELHGMLDWADALGHPPENEWMGLGPRGQVIFLKGDYEGQPVEHHPKHLHWMTMARVREGGRWAWRYPESLRRWAERCLRVRSSGRARQNPKSFGPGDWTIDSNALLPTQDRGRAS